MNQTFSFGDRPHLGTVPRNKSAFSVEENPLPPSFRHSGLEPESSSDSKGFSSKKRKTGSRLDLRLIKGLGDSQIFLLLTD